MKLFWLKLIAFFSPKILFKLAAKERDWDSDKIEAATKLFSGAQQIDFWPSGGREGRSLIITLDNKMALFFYQNGDTFSYDGFEIGLYENGEVTVFDSIKNAKAPFK